MLHSMIYDDKQGSVPCCASGTHKLSNYAAYCVVAKDSVSKQISIAFLERLKADFKKRYGGGKADTAMPKSLKKEYG